MTDLRKLLIEAHEAIGAIVDSNIFDRESQHYYQKLRSRIDAALAENVEPVAWSCVNEVAALGLCEKWCGDRAKCPASFGKE